MDPAALGILIVFVSFAIDRVASALIYLGVSVQVLRHRPEGGTSPLGLRLQAIFYYLIGAALAATFLAHFPAALILASLKIDPGAHWMDYAITLIVLVGGADRFASVFQSGHKAASAEARDRPIEITGRVEVVGSEKPAGR